MSDNITELCFEIEHIIATFELSNSMKIRTIKIDRNDAGEITAVRAAGYGEYRNQNR